MMYAVPAGLMVVALSVWAYAWRALRRRRELDAAVRRRLMREIERTES